MDVACHSLAISLHNYFLKYDHGKVNVYFLKES